MGTFSRLRYVIAANVNALLEKAEDPGKLLRALIREMEEAGEEARAASAEVLAELRIDDEHDNVRTFDRASRQQHADLLDGRRRMHAARATNTGRIDDSELASMPLERGVHRITRGSRDVGDDHALLTEQPVDE